MCSTLEQVENFLRSPPSDCLNLSTNNGLDLSCSSSYYNEECLNLSAKASYSQKPQDLSLQHPQQPPQQQQQQQVQAQQQQHHQNNEIVNLSTTDSRNYFYQTRQDDDFYHSNSGYDRNSPLNLERRSSPLNLTFPQPSSKQRSMPNKYYDYSNNSQNSNNGYYSLGQQTNPCDYQQSNASTPDFNNYNSNSYNNSQNQVYCTYGSSNSNNTYYNHHQNISNEVFFTCSQCVSHFRDQVSLETHIKNSHQKHHHLWGNQQYDHYGGSMNHTSDMNTINMPQNYATRQVEMPASQPYNNYMPPHLGEQSNQVLSSPPSTLQVEASGGNATHSSPSQDFVRPTEPSPIHPCADCKITFSSGRDLKKHIDLAHDGRKKVSTSEDSSLYQCATCLKEFKCTTSLSSHLQEHKSEKPHKCDKCPQLFRNLSGLKRHLKRVHGKEKMGFKCETCGKGFYERHDLLRHVKIHSVPKCSDCGKNIKNKVHDCKKKSPSSGKNYPCEICSDSLDSKISWGYHMWKHTKDSSYITTTEDDDDESTQEASVNTTSNSQQPLCLQKNTKEDPKPLNMHQTIN